VPQPGTAADPFIVRTVADLQKVATDTDGWTGGAHYRQEANINLSSVPNWRPIGSSGQGGFWGVYDGNGYSINNLTITGTSADQIRGLFRAILDDGVVRNVALRNVNITTTVNYVGGIAGSISVNSLIENSYVTGTITGSRWVGGIAGHNTGGVIQNCYSAANVTGTDATTTSVGGIVGYITGEGAKVSRCYALGKITGRSNVGGIAGYVQSPATVERNVALNVEVSMTETFDEVGRVIGDLSNNHVLFGFNYARSAGMRLANGNGVVVTSSNGYSKHGENIDAAPSHGASSATWWSSSNPGFTAANWTFAANRLPHLRTTTGGAFAETQNPTVQ